MTPEHQRLAQENQDQVSWKKWGPYLSERQWGTVREDYSRDGNAWDYFSHDQARSRAYRWGEDGLAGISDEKQKLCFALALWNGKDPILKERLFGLTNAEGNHGEDVKEYYFYLDSTPTHSYMKYLYKYPQAAFPYDDLVQTNRARTRNESEYELLDTGVFDHNRYFDVFVEYAKQSPQDLLIQITVHNRGPDDAQIHLLPTLWFRNQWSWDASVTKPVLRDVSTTSHSRVIQAQHPKLGTLYLHCEGDAPLLFTENQTNTQRIFGTPNVTPYVKDGIANHVVHAHPSVVNPDHIGTKAAQHHQITVKPGQPHIIRLRLNTTPPNPSPAALFGTHFDAILHTRRSEADAFYAAVIPASLNPDQTNLMRQSLAGMLWTKQYYHFDVDKWLEERGSDPFKTDRKSSPRNDSWHHMYNGDIISMPDKWEYPWFAAWDLAFHVLALSLVDPEFGKQQLKLMLSERYMHPNGQIPAYEWNFGDVNPPVHAWATIFAYRIQRTTTGKGDREWLKSSFQKLLLNFTWWVNRKDRSGRNVFEGGFLGLDNIGVFDRSAPLPTGGYLEQADGTAWMALFCQNMFEISLELAQDDPEYEDMVLKFAQHFLWIASAMGHMGGDTGMWDEEDGFFYDVLRLPDGQAQRLKVRSMVGLLPLCAATTIDGELIRKYPQLAEKFQGFLQARPELSSAIHDPTRPGIADRRLASILDETRLRRVLARMLDEKEFLSDFGIRSLSRFHAENPYTMHVNGQDYTVPYLPGESDSGLFGGNSNWRGPIWIPVNTLILRALLQYHAYYGSQFTVECPTGSGQHMNLYQVAAEIARRLESIFLKDKDGRRPTSADTLKFQEDPHWRDCMQFFEYFHGDSGAGLGANHQTGWTGIIARIMHLFATTNSQTILENNNKTYFNPNPPPNHNP